MPTRKTSHTLNAVFVLFFEGQHCLDISCVFPHCKTLVINIFGELIVTKGLSMNVQLGKGTSHLTSEVPLRS